MNVESEFQDFILQTNKDGSNKARSYLLALKSVTTLLRGGFLPEFDIGDIYDVTDVEAFKAHLITFDEKLRLVLSKSLREHTTSNIFNAVFKQYENTRIRSALHFPPAEKFLARHRELLAG